MACHLPSVFDGACNADAEPTDGAGGVSDILLTLNETVQCGFKRGHNG